MHKNKIKVHNINGMHVDLFNEFLHIRTRYTYDIWKRQYGDKQKKKQHHYPEQK